MKKRTAYFKQISALLLFGFNGIVASRIALNSYEIVFTRTLIGSLLLGLIFGLTRRKAHLFDNKKHFLYLMVSGVAMGASWMFLYEAYRQVGVSVATLAYYCGPVIVMVLSPLLFGERITWVKVLGFLAVLAGMVCVNRQSLAGDGTLWGLVCGILSAMTYAVMVIFNKKARSVTGLENALGQLVFAFITVAVFLGFKQGFTLRIEPGSILPILVLGLVNTGIGCYFYFSSIADLPVQTVAVCGYLEPLSAILFSVMLLGETLSAIQVIGAVLILGGAAFAELCCRKSRPDVSPDGMKANTQPLR